MAESAASRSGLRFAILVLPFAILTASILLPGDKFGCPQQIHLSWSGLRGDALTVTWVTNARAAGSRVVFGRGSLADRHVADSTKAALEDDPGLYLHTASLGRLESGEYVYTLGQNQAGWSSAYRFRIRSGDPAPLTFTATADTGVDRAAKESVKRMQEADPEFVLHAGDLGYATRHPWRWNAFFNMIEPLATRAPYMTVPGNHEHKALLGLGSYFARLALPNNEHFYSFDYGNLHVVGLDSGPAYGRPPDEMTAWLSADLERSARDPLHPWKIVFFHFPPFSSGPHGSWMEGREVWSPIFDRYGVSLVIGGHNHLYERTWPVSASSKVARSSYDDPERPVYVVTGGGGSKINKFPGAPPAWSAFRAATKETLRVTVASGLMTIAAVQPDGSLLDSFTIRRGSVPGMPQIRPEEERPAAPTAH